jgi:hypothetical protein
MAARPVGGKLQGAKVKYPYCRRSQKVLSVTLLRMPRVCRVSRRRRICRVSKGAASPVLWLPDELLP